LTREIADEGNSSEVRMMGALVFKNFVSNRGSVNIKSNINEIMIIGQQVY
jgi:hypothetical protein